MDTKPLAAAAHIQRDGPERAAGAGLCAALSGTRRQR